MPEIKIFPKPSHLVEAAADIFIELGRRAIQERNRFLVALSGGSTPLPLYQFLAHPNQDSALDWNKVHFFWGDERPVSKDHPDSNFFQAFQALLSPRDIPSQNIHRILGERPPRESARQYQQEILEHLPGDPPQFDLILLGMGSDGHTASLFPGTEVVTNPDQTGPPWVEAVWVERLETWRISFTPQLINASRRILFLVVGENKADTLKQVLHGPYHPQRLPSQMIDGNLTWLVDQSAAAKLDPI
jgi:6-phosphogluconolactonase